LSGYKIRSRNIRHGEAVVKGYHREDFHDAWERYLPRAPKGGGPDTEGRSLGQEPTEGAGDHRESDPSPAPSHQSPLHPLHALEMVGATVIPTAPSSATEALHPLHPLRGQESASQQGDTSDVMDPCRGRSGAEAPDVAAVADVADFRGDQERRIREYTV
jgi:hypothetical protein